MLNKLTSLEDHQINGIFSLISTTTMLGLNLYYPWASKDALVPCAYILFAYNFGDLIFSYKRYMKSKNLGFVFHHLMVVIGSIIMHYYLLPNYSHGLYRVIRWLYLAEVSTFFFSIRTLLLGTRYENISTKLFGLSFLIFRSIQTIGFTFELYKNSYFFLFAPVWVVLTALNIHWGYLITSKVVTLEPYYYTFDNQYKSITRHTH